MGRKEREREKRRKDKGVTETEPITQTEPSRIHTHTHTQAHTHPVILGLCGRPCFLGAPVLPDCGVFPKVAAYPGSKWNPLANEKEYKMAILDYILAGGDGYTMVKAGARCSCMCHNPRASFLRRSCLVLHDLRCCVRLHSPNPSEGAA